MEHSFNLIEKTRKKFIVYSIVGLALFGTISTIGLKLHFTIVEQQATIQNLYSKLTGQFAIVHKIALLSERVEVANIKEDLIRLKPEFESLITELKEENELFDQWLRNNDSSKIEDLESILKEKEFKSKMLEYIKRARALVDKNSDTKNELIKDLKSLSKGSLTHLIKTFKDIEQNIMMKQENSSQKLSRMGIFLVALCLLQVVLAWLLVFRPLYSTILIQHKKLSNAFLRVKSASRSKTEFLANISHEIRTPMTAILGYAELLKRDNLDQKEKEESVNIINQNASHLMGLIDEILDISKIEAGKFNFEKQKVHLSTLLNEVYSLINVKSQDKGINLIFRHEGAIPEVIYSDPKRLKQILFNIVGNAIKFTKQGSVQLVVSYNQKTKKVLMLVIDTGCGISKKRIRKLFTPFEQADNSVNREHTGTGLGLVLSRGLAQGMGGDVKIVKSEVGVGTSILTTIDIGYNSNVNLVTSFSTNIIESEVVDQKLGHSTLAGKSILVVDDAKENARLFKMYLAEAGADVKVANNGQQALDIALDYKFDLILLDLQMPGKDGYQVISELRHKNFLNPIVALTAHAMSEEKEKTRAAGFDDHITKPVSPELLVKSILKLLNNQ